MISDYSLRKRRPDKISNCALWHDAGVSQEPPTTYSHIRIRQKLRAQNRKKNKRTPQPIENVAELEDEDSKLEVEVEEPCDDVSPSMDAQRSANTMLAPNTMLDIHARAAKKKARKSTS